MAGDTSALHDAEAQVSTSLRDITSRTAAAGLVSRAPIYFTMELVLRLDAHSLACKAITLEDKQMSVQVRSVADHVNYMADMHKWAWSHTTVEQLRLLPSPAECDAIRRNQYASVIGGATLLYEASLNISGEALMRKMPEYFRLCDAAARLLVDDDLRRAQQEVCSPWAKVLEAETDSHRDPQVKLFFDLIIELQMPLVRLFFAILEDDLRVRQFGRSLEMARGLIVRLPDEKAPEYLHQRIRNYQKTRRSRSASNRPFSARCKPVVCWKIEA